MILCEKGEEKKPSLHTNYYFKGIHTNILINISYFDEHIYLVFIHLNTSSNTNNDQNSYYVKLLKKDFPQILKCFELCT